MKKDLDEPKGQRRASAGMGCKQIGRDLKGIQDGFQGTVFCEGKNEENHSHGEKREDLQDIGEENQISFRVFVT